MFHYLYHSVTSNESKEKFRIAFCCFSETKNIVAPSSSSNFPKKLICWAILIFNTYFLTHLYQWGYNNFDDTNNLINFMLNSSKFHVIGFLFVFTGSKNSLLSINALKSFISTSGM